ncbi:MAG: hypothetical protein GY851_24810 [bacterium]|nr:hypothetical protein [bacterium]
MHLAASLLTFAAIAFGADEAPRSLGDLTGPWQLLVDDHLIEERTDVSREYGTFARYPDNPVMPATEPWEGDMAYLYGTVLPGEDGAGYRAWYHSWAHGEYRMLYATSDDGLTWDKPELGLVDYKGSKANNILFRRTHENHSPQVMHTPWDADSDSQYKLLYFEYGRTPPDFTVTGYYGMTSPDGIHWTDVSKKPVFLDSPGDVGNFVWDPLKKRYVGWPKKFSEVRGYRRRCVGYTETTDFELWPESELVLVPDEIDDRWVGDDDPEKAHTDFYGLCGFAYETMYIGFLWMFPITDGGNDGPCFVELVTSRDGKNWERQEQREHKLLPLGDAGTWDDGMVFTPNHPLVEGDTIKLFYGGFDVTHGSGAGRGCVGIATLRKDGFAWLRAGESGIVTTKPLTGTSGRLAVNYAAKGGALRVEVTDAAGHVIPGYGRNDCAPLTGDSVDEQVRWKEHENLPETDGAIRLRFVMNQASLYSFNGGPDVGLAP